MVSEGTAVPGLCQGMQVPRQLVQILHHQLVGPQDLQVAIKLPLYVICQLSHKSKCNLQILLMLSFILYYK